MPVIARSSLDADAEGLERLRRVLHGPSARGRLEADDRPPIPGRGGWPGLDPAPPPRLLVDRRRDTVR